MKKPWNVRYSLILLSSIILSCNGQDYGTPKEDGAGGDEPPPEMASCNGIFLSYSFISREREYPHVKNVTAQSWAFKASAMIVNAGKEELKGWQMFIGFRHKELLVSANGASPMDGDFPLDASNGTTFIGSENPDLKTSIETAGDFTQISSNIEITGTLFGVAKSVTPMPRTIKLINDGWECPAAKRKGGNMHVCCKRNPKIKVKTGPKTKFTPRRDFAFEDWFVAIEMGKAGPGYENVYSFNGTGVSPKNRTVLFQGLPGMNYLVGQVNGTNPLKDPPVPGKQQSVISFTKKNIKGLNIPEGDGFPTRLFFNGEECALPKHFPTKSSGDKPSFSVLMSLGFSVVVAFAVMMD